MLTSIFAALAALPKILGYLERFAAWLTEQIENYKKQQLATKMDKAAETAQKTKDTSQIDDLFKGKK